LTEYFPGPNDKATGETELCLYAFAVSPCADATQCITLTILPSATVNAGEDDVICETGTVTLNATAENYDEVFWTTTGDGAFDDPTILTAIYSPGVQDIETGNVTLTVDVTSEFSCDNVSDDLTISIAHLPWVYVGENTTICANESFPVTGDADNYAGLEWQSSGDGTFETNSELTTIYYPGPGDISLGQVEICLKVESVEPCTNSQTDCLTLVLEQMPYVDAGELIEVCGNQIIPLNPIVGNYSDLIWTTSGDGTFDDPSSAQTNYHPGPQDNSDATFDLCLTASSEGACDDVTDCVTVIINKLAIVWAGFDATIYDGEVFQTTNAFAKNYSSLLWTTSGNGTFENPDTVNTVYIPSDDDILAGEVTLTITLNPLFPCISIANDNLVLTINQDCADPIVNAGNDIVICEDQGSVQLSAYVLHTSSLSWTTAGDGIFSNQSIFDPEYTLGNNDQTNGSVKLYLLGEAYGQCSSALDSLFIFVNKLPVVFAGNDQVICADTLVELSEATASDFASVIWSTEGDGTFGDINELNTNYQPGPADIEGGSAVLNLTAEPLNPCTTAAESYLTVIINLVPEIVQDILSQEVLLGNQALFTIEAINVETYNWYGPQGFIPDNNLPGLTIEVTAYEDAGEYYCEVINSCGQKTSSIVTLTVYEEHSVGFTVGWSGISSWIDPFDPSIENIFKDVENQLITLSNFTGVYYPGYNINTLNNWDSQDGYQVKFSEMVDQKFIGAANTNRIVDLVAGWNYLPVVVACPVDVEELFENMTEVEMIKEIAGNGVYWPAMGINSIGELQPGNAYLIRVTGQIEVEFADCGPGFKSDIVSSVHRPDNMTIWNEVNYTPSTHIFAIDNEILDQLNIGDVIGAFTTDGTCAGISEIKMQNNSLTLYGDDQMTETADGFAENSSIRFKVYRPSTGEEFELKVYFDRSFPNAEGVFVSNGISKILDATMNALSVTEISANAISLYPNPTMGTVNISGLESGSTIEVYTSGGQVLETISVTPGQSGPGILSVDLSAYPAGIIYFRITGRDKVEVRKVILK
jgi:hypothetical protein